MTEQQHVLYRIYDKHDRLLYVGMTLGPTERFRTHSVKKGWWGQVSSIKLEHFSSRPELAAAEVTAIRDEDPLFNVASRPPMGPVRPRKSPERSPRQRLEATRERISNLDLVEISPGLPPARLQDIGDALIDCDLGEMRIHDAVQDARRDRYTWRQIAAVCGVSHQAAMERFNRKEN